MEDRPVRRLERDGNGGNLTAARIEREYATHAAAAVSMSRLRGRKLG